MTENAVVARDFVIKIASRCNINCDYCYMYNKGDRSYLKQPKLMSLETVEALAQEIKMHGFLNELTDVNLILHGGEPLLAGLELMNKFVETIEQELVPDIKPHYFIQTNGILINDDWCQFFKTNNFNVSVSLDGPENINDIHRLDHKGNGTFKDTLKGIEKLNEFELSPGLLMVINPDTNPIEMYHFFKKLNFKSVDLLLPDFHHDSPPPSTHNYSTWMTSVFDEWFADTGQKPTIPFFRKIMKLILGADYNDEYFGTGVINTIVVETNGDIEPLDALKICGDNFTKVGLSIKDGGLEHLSSKDLIRDFAYSKLDLCETCSKCIIKDVCGGGFMPHRYKKDSGFNNPSVYCKDLIKIIVHIQNKVFDALPDNLKTNHSLEKISFENVVQQIL